MLQSDTENMTAPLLRLPESHSKVPVCHSEKHREENGVYIVQAIIENLPEQSASVSKTEDILVEQIEETLDLASDRSLLGQWLDLVTPFLKPGGKPVALILSLGVVSVPLLMSGSSLVAPILAVGAVIVAIIVAIR